ncbi:hypothetical protein M9H77_27033 [Catharanthus roseus]|uniref:Uncharacterized protein n=1 Tax=Catharanthus roseus TaxID=4058 RepID=A0ACC0ABJ5_CATRO|nr:hypothetical protein M9H77_27033 [Catharanthus roseus]
MTELLGASTATRRYERVPAPGFQPLEFYGEAEQEIKAELFLEQLSDIYDTLKYEDVLSLQPPINVLDKNHESLGIPRDPVASKRSEMKAGEPKSLEESIEYVHTVVKVDIRLICVIES